jgi:hypothetical protein
MGIGSSFDSMSKFIILSYYIFYLNFIMALIIEQIENRTVRTGPLKHFRFNGHQNYLFPVCKRLRS